MITPLSDIIQNVQYKALLKSPISVSVSVNTIKSNFKNEGLKVDLSDFVGMLNCKRFTAKLELFKGKPYMITINHNPNN